MILLIVIMYFVVAAVTFRYTGYVNNQQYIEDHPYARLCQTCICVDCGGTRYAHKNWYGRDTCNRSYEDNDPDNWTGVHGTALLYGACEAIAWPLVLTAYGLKMGARASGVTHDTYFKPPPQIRTRDERRATREIEKNEELKRLRARNLELEHELGIGQP